MVIRLLQAAREELEMPRAGRGRGTGKEQQPAEEAVLRRGAQLRSTQGRPPQFPRC